MSEPYIEVIVKVGTRQKMLAFERETFEKMSTQQVGVNVRYAVEQVLRHHDHGWSDE